MMGASRGNLVKSTPKKKDQKPTCPWTLHISNVRQEGSWTVKTYFKDHTCLQPRDVNLCTINWLAWEIEPTIKSDPNKKPRNIVEDLQKKFPIEVSPYQVSRAKAMAEKKVLGDYEAQYESLRDYTEELVRSNPGTTVKLDIEPCCDPSSPTRQFRRIYICFGALKEWFKLGGRDLLGLDGCFMKGPFPGQILTSVGMDGNNGIYPLAYSLVEAETTASRTWFLECLGDDLDLYSNSNFTFISDRQNVCIIPALQKVFPSAEHRYCLRHIHENMKPRWRGVVYKNMFQKCAFATTPQEFERCMKEIQNKDATLYDWLKEIPPKHSSRAYFSGMHFSLAKEQLIMGRDKPVITCLEFIREYLMRRMVVVHKTIARCQGPLTLVATKLFDKIMAEANNYTVIWNGSTKYQLGHNKRSCGKSKVGPTKAKGKQDRAAKSKGKQGGASKSKGKQGVARTQADKASKRARTEAVAAVLDWIMVWIGSNVWIESGIGCFGLAAAILVSCSCCSFGSAHAAGIGCFGYAHVAILDQLLLQFWLAAVAALLFW
ncbi:uncharacterized protein LOC143635367 [Bidens hawaiensis]|uniref:uncharacterized protein LOC143635367 n=1 Tax=Bidens hawaiensis TaxID=980011 RepID=UPI00404AB5E6